MFKVYAQIENDRVKMKTSGIASSVMGSFVSDMMEIFDDTKPSKVENDKLIYSTWMPPIPSKAFDRLVSSQMSAMRGKFIPEQITISITEECPNRCLHCALPDTKNKAKLDPEAVKSVIDQTQDMGTTLIIFDGGEPLLYDGLEDLISYVDQSKAIPGLFTSGVGMTPERAQSLKRAGLSMLSISLDSANEEGHDHMRGRPGVFKEAVNAIKCGLDAGLLVGIYVVLSPRNVDELDDFYELATELGVHELSFYEIVPTGRWQEHEKEVVSPEGLKKFDDFVERTSTGEGPRVFPIPQIIRKMGCFAGRKWLHVTPEGDVLPCACMPKPYGNIHYEKLAAIWKKIYKDPVFNSGPCLMRDTEFRKIHLKLEQ
ncbi:Radical SAM superfamily enzyme, MoaA/NifB/PqqE/SkfB family [Methanolobus profundi]|uniref:Radical SAM superfamily enzyme, MoaA/NifB/PqqE/SkfB family n=1 Tax=Methanolobus profundi TaxID=487685 RepID=A0A1I4TII0_9EURY|nr:Radical SAM superfamily enzyme, MoaA/NifB/PqqE/SkfB family [Methanolobus profundi]